VRLTRERRPELMDRLDVDRGQLSHSLRDLDAVNRWLGGRRTAVSLVLDLAARVGGPMVTVLDIGTGGADIPLALVVEARRTGIRLRVTATDLHPGALEFARDATRSDPDVEVLPADALRLPFADASFDVALCTTTLHHFPEGDAVQALHEMARVARHGVVVTDLARSRAALAGAWILARTAWRRHPITRHDGPVSVRAAFTPAELRALGARAFGEVPRVRREPIFRLSLVLDRTAGITPEAGAAAGAARQAELGRAAARGGGR
jgi:2-polyprenyl-3-methyl-5-hydroxy-6-metoxy-1,4-benzoquinol methylase